MKKMVYIAGLSHVGSTALDLFLGSHPRFVGLGEVFQLIRPDFDRYRKGEICSCGKTTNDCPFWSVAADRLNNLGSRDVRHRYREVIDVFDEIYGRDYVLVDSSKILAPLKTLLSLSAVDIKLIYLIRDVRSWTISRLNHRAKLPNYYQRDGFYVKKLSYHYGWKIKILRGLMPFLTRMNSYYFILWYYQNRNFKRFIIQNKIFNMSLGYEELAMNPEKMIPRIFNFLGEYKDDTDFSSENSQSHIVVGNIKKTDPDRRKGIFYDNRWLYDNRLMVTAALFPWIMKYNADHVYQNIRKDSMWK